MKYMGEIIGDGFYRLSSPTPCGSAAAVKKKPLFARMVFGSRYPLVMDLLLSREEFPWVWSGFAGGLCEWFERTEGS